MIETRDYEGVARLAHHDTAIAGLAEHLQMIWNKVLNPDDRSRRRSGGERAADEAWAADTLRRFVDGVYDRLADLTKEQAQREVGVVAKIIDGLKRGQRLRDAMTREQFHDRYVGLSRVRP